MTTPITPFSAIKDEITNKQGLLNAIHTSRVAVSGDQLVTSPSFVQSFAAKMPDNHRTFSLLAQGDSWFDYPPGTDLIDCLHEQFGHTINNIAVAGSTLNDEAYGPVPRELFGLPDVGPLQSDDPSRIAELIHRIQEYKPQALLLSAGGNDVAGDDFFTYLNNAKSGLDPVNPQILAGAVNFTFKAAYEYIITSALQAADEQNLKMPIFVHGYDYPWPDGRGLIHFIGWKIGPWFNDSFNLKNYPYADNDQGQLLTRHNILKVFIDSVNDMLKTLEQKYPQQVFYVDLRNTLASKNDWANELHPNNSGFSQLAAKINAALQQHV